MILSVTKKAEYITDGVWYENVPVGHNTIGKHDEGDLNTS